MLQWSQTRSCEGPWLSPEGCEVSLGLGGSRGSQGWARGWAEGDPYPFRLVPHLQAEAGKVERRASHMQREARREETKREKRRGGEERTEVSPDTSVCLSMPVLEPGDRARPHSQPITNPWEPQGARAALAGLQNRKGNDAASPWDKPAGFHESWRQLQTLFLQGAWPISSTHRAGVPTQGEVSIPPHPEAKALLGLHSQEGTDRGHPTGREWTSWPSPAAVWGAERGPQEQPLLQHSTWSGNTHTNGEKRHWEVVGGTPPVANGRINEGAVPSVLTHCRKGPAQMSPR